MLLYTSQKWRMIAHIAYNRYLKATMDTQKGIYCRGPSRRNNILWTQNYIKSLIGLAFFNSLLSYLSCLFCHELIRNVTVLSACRNVTNYKRTQRLQLCTNHLALHREEEVGGGVGSRLKGLKEIKERFERQPNLFQRKLFFLATSHSKPRELTKKH